LRDRFSIATVRITMVEFDGKLIEMTLQGDIIAPPPQPSWLTRIAAAAVILAVMAGVAAFLVFSLWIFVALIPVIVIGGLVAYGAIKLQLWRLRSMGQQE